MKKKLKNFFKRLLPLLLISFAASDVSGQTFQGMQVASVAPPPPVTLKAGEELSVSLTVRIRSGYHINSDAPAEDYLIPTKLTWGSQELRLKKVKYPEPEIVSYEFSAEPLWVFSDTIVIESAFAVPEKVPASLTELTGKLRYQACTNKACLPPKTAEVRVPVHPR